MWLFLAGCVGGGSDIPDLGEILDATEARAGRISDSSVLFGGISAEGRAGDWLLYNNRVRFIVQDDREGSYYVGSGGGIIDADIVRAEGVPGADAIDEWAGMIGLGRLLEPEWVRLGSDGSSGGPASVEVFGGEGELELLEGALEVSDLVQNDNIRMQRTYSLAPDSWLLRVDTTFVHSGDEPVAIAPGDILMGSLEALETYEPGTGLDGVADGDKMYSGLMGRRNEVAVAIFPPLGETLSAGALGLLAEVADLSAAQGTELVLEPDQPQTFSRYYGVGPDLATLTDSWMALSDIETRRVEGVVSAPDGPVAGARVHVLTDGEPFTIAVTDSEGRYSADVPAGATESIFVDGMGRSLFFDLPDGAPYISAYGAPAVKQQALAQLVSGAVGVPVAEGRGTSEDGTLGEPGTLVVQASDAGPFEVRVRPTGGAPARDPRLVRGRPEGGAVGWGIDDLSMLLEPGEYDVTVHRGLRHELHTQTVSVSAGDAVEIIADLGTAISHEGYLLGDPHIHASPSSDAAVPMEERILGVAGVGLQLHFGTDHDHVADYQPIVEAVGLDDHMHSVVATEFSPPLRGHMNFYPLRQRSELPNGGGVPWWRDFEVSTEDMVQRQRDAHGEFVLQLNHTLSSGMLSAADWSPGEIGRPERFSMDFEAMELMNAGNYTDHIGPYLDLVTRGVSVVPTGVSDSHGHTNSSFGLSATWLGFGTEQVGGYSDADLLDVFARGDTIVTRGPFLDLSIPPGSTLGPGETIRVESVSPSWIVVDRLLLMRDGVVVETVQGTTAEFVLDAETDAVYHVLAEGDTPMAPLTGRTPWAMTGAYRVDVDGNGWQAPLAPLVMGSR